MFFSNTRELEVDCFRLAHSCLNQFFGKSKRHLAKQIWQRQGKREKLYFGLTNIAQTRLCPGFLMSKCFPLQKLGLSTTIACVTDETKPLDKSVYEPAPKPLFWAPSLYQDLSTCHDWLVKNPLSICVFRQTHRISPRWFRERTHFFFSNTTNPLLTMFVRSRRLNFELVLFCVFIDL